MGAAPPNPAHRNPIRAPQMNMAERMEMGASPPNPAHRNPTEEEKAAQERRRNTPRPPPKKRPQRLRFNDDKNISNSFNEDDAPEAIRHPRVRKVQQPVTPIYRSKSMPNLSIVTTGSDEDRPTTFRPIVPAIDVHPRATPPASPTSPTTIKEYGDSIVRGNKDLELAHINMRYSPDSPDIGWHGGRRHTKVGCSTNTKRTKRTKRRRSAKR